MRDLLAMLLLSVGLFWFAWQPLQDQANSDKALLIHNVAHDVLSEAKIQGYFTTANLQAIQNTIATDLGYPTSEVSVQGTIIPQTRGQFLYLTVSVPTNLEFIQLGPNSVMITQSESAMSEAIQ